MFGLTVDPRIAVFERTWASSCLLKHPSGWLILLGLYILQSLSNNLIYNYLKLKTREKNNLKEKRSCNNMQYAIHNSDGITTVLI